MYYYIIHYVMYKKPSPISHWFIHWSVRNMTIEFGIRRYRTHHIDGQSTFNQFLSLNFIKCIKFIHQGFWDGIFLCI